MSMIKKTVIIIVPIVVAIIIAVIVLMGIYEGGFFSLAPSYNKMDRFLRTNIDELSYVSAALSRLDYNSIEIRKEPLSEQDRYNMKVNREYLIYETVPISDELVGHIQYLYESGVDVISHSRNSINFTMWSNMDESRGIIYSTTGKVPDGEQLVTVKQLSIENWYYYVHNYKKAKSRNPELFQ